jgi:hypothetical protein
MSWYRKILLAAVAGGALLLTSAPAQQPAQLAKPPAAPAAPPPKGDPQARAALDAAIKALEVKKLGWVETTVWQQSDMQGVTLLVDGSYLAGPDHHLHLNLKVHVADLKGRLEVFCDGQTMWEVMQVGNGDPAVLHKIDLERVLQTLNGPAVTAEVRDLFFRNLSFFGMVPLLEVLRDRMTFTQKEAARWHGHDVVKLTGVWTPEMAQSVRRPGAEAKWPAYLPRECRLYLGAEVPHWPYRLEWWGPSPHADNVLLMQMEFRDPRALAALPAERLAREFTYRPAGGEPAPDVTDQMIKWVIQRASQMAPR